MMKRRFDQDVNKGNWGAEKVTSKLKNIFKPKQQEVHYEEEHVQRRPHFREKSEEYLPFNKEEIRPVIRDNEIYSDRYSVETILLDALSPMIEQWLDDNLERIVHRVVKRAMAKKDINYIYNEVEPSLFDERNYRQQKDGHSGKKLKVLSRNKVDKYNR